MKHLITGILLLFVLGGVHGQSSLLDSSVTDINGRVRHLDDFGGKKLWILVLPLGHSQKKDSLFLERLDSICDFYSHRVEVIAVPAYEAGYSDALTPELQAWLGRWSRPNLLVTKGMYIKREAGPLQSGLFRWLTDAHRNGHFDLDAEGPGQHFLVNEVGTLYRVYSRESRLSWKSIKRMFY
jgi:hypothetical protein